MFQILVWNFHITRFCKFWIFLVLITYNTVLHLQMCYILHIYVHRTFWNVTMGHYFLRSTMCAVSIKDIFLPFCSKRYSSYISTTVWLSFEPAHTWYLNIKLCVIKRKYNVVFVSCTSETMDIAITKLSFTVGRSVLEVILMSWKILGWRL